MYWISDKDECAETTPICGTGGTCLNTEGSYTCTCTTGYELVSDGTTCAGNDTMCLFVWPL